MHIWRPNIYPYQLPNEPFRSYMLLLDLQYVPCTTRPMSIEQCRSSMWSVAAPHFHVVSCSPTAPCGQLQCHSSMWSVAVPQLHVVSCSAAVPCGQLQCHSSMHVHGQLQRIFPDLTPLLLQGLQCRRRVLWSRTSAL